MLELNQFVYCQNNQPGPVLVLVVTPSSFFISCLTNAKRAISIAKAIKVIRAAKNAVSEERRVIVTCVESESKNAMKVTPAATGGFSFERTG